jgi:hypothetical protein
MAATVCMYGNMALALHWLVTGATGQTGTPNDRRPEESLTTSVLLVPATPVLSARVDCLAVGGRLAQRYSSGALATVTEPTLKFLNRDLAALGGPSRLRS